jgi:hypothetical protein
MTLRSEGACEIVSMRGNPDLDQVMLPVGAICVHTFNAFQIENYD